MGLWGPVGGAGVRGARRRPGGLGAGRSGPSSGVGRKAGGLPEEVGSVAAEGDERVDADGAGHREGGAEHAEREDPGVASLIGELVRSTNSRSSIRAYKREREVEACKYFKQGQ